jgi:hypothetical protein
MRSGALLALSALATLSGAGSSRAAPAVLGVEVLGPRVTLADLAPSACDDGAAVDLGPAPAPGGSRLLARAELDAAARDAKVTCRRLPSAVRVVRKMRSLDARALEALAREGLEGSLPRGASLARVRAPRAVTVADGWDRVEAIVPRTPRRRGTFATTVRLRLERAGAEIGSLDVPVELALSEAAEAADVEKGAPLSVIVASGLVQVTAAAIAGASGDAGSIIPVTIRTSGRVLRARIVDRTRAVAEDG